MARKRIFWNEIEKASIVKKTAEIIRQYPDMPMFRAVGEAQEAILPANRRRSWLTKATLGTLAKDIETELNRPVASRITVASGTDDREMTVVRAAMDFAYTSEAELVQRARESGASPPSAELLLILWAANFKAYMEARYDKL